MAETVSPISLKNLVAITRLGQEFTREDVTHLLQSRSRKRSLNESYVQQCINWAKELNLLEETDGILRRLPNGAELAAQQDDTPQLRSTLHSLLLQNNVYRRFISLLNENPRFQDFTLVERKGGWIGRPNQQDNHATPNRLKGWAKELWIIAELRPSRRFILIDQSLKMSDMEFWDNLLEIYNYVRTREGRSSFGTRIPTVRDEFCYRWRVHSNYFDQRLASLFSSREFGSLIRLSSAPARYLRELERNGYVPVKIGKKQYMYMELTARK